MVGVGVEMNTSFVFGAAALAIGLTSAASAATVTTIAPTTAGSVEVLAECGGLSDGAFGVGTFVKANSKSCNTPDSAAQITVAPNGVKSRTASQTLPGVGWHSAATRIQGATEILTSDPNLIGGEGTVTFNFDVDGSFRGWNYSLFFQMSALTPAEIDSSGVVDGIHRTSAVSTVLPVGGGASNTTGLQTIFTGVTTDVDIDASIDVSFDVIFGEFLNYEIKYHTITRGDASADFLDTLTFGGATAKDTFGSSVDVLLNFNSSSIFGPAPNSVSDVSAVPISPSMAFTLSGLLVLGGLQLRQGRRRCKHA